MKRPHIIPGSTKLGIVNFLPWQQQRKRKVKREIIVVLSIAACVIAVVVFVRDFDFAKARAPLEDQLSKHKQTLQEMRKAQNNYQAYRIDTPSLSNKNRLLATLALLQAHMPDDMHIQSVDIEENIQVSGFATHSESLKTLLVAMRDPKRGINAHLRQSVSQKEGIDFVITLTLPVHYCAYTKCTNALQEP